MVSCGVPALLRGVRSDLFIFVLFFMILKDGSKKNLPHFMSKCVLLFSLRVSLSVHLFRPLIYLQFIFACNIRSIVISFWFSLLRTLPGVLHSSCPIGRSQYQCRRALFPPHPLQHLLFVEYHLTVGILTGVRWQLVEALICISLIFSDIDMIFWNYEFEILPYSEHFSSDLP